MKQLFKIVFILALIISVNGNTKLIAQGVVYGDYPQSDTTVQVDSGKELFKPSVKLSLGTSFLSYGRGYNAFSTFVAPEISMPVSDKFSVSFGMGYSNMFFNSPSEFGAQQNSTSYGNLYVSGTYQVNDKLIIRGSAYKTFLLNTSAEGKSLNSQFFDFSSQGVIFDAEYKVSDKFKIGVSVEYRDANYPTLYQNGFNSFGASPFRTPSFGIGY